MKKIILVAIVLLCSISAISQSKIGTVDIEYIIAKMPELTKVRENLNEYGTGLQKQLQDKMTKYQADFEAYNTTVQNLSATEKEEKEKAIIALEDEITKFQQNAVQLIRLREDDLKRPLYQKIGQELEKIATAESYTQILATDNNTVVFVDPNYDLTLKILTNFGITIEEE